MLRHCCQCALPILHSIRPYAESNQSYLQGLGMQLSNNEDQYIKEIRKFTDSKKFHKNQLIQTLGSSSVDLPSPGRVYCKVFFIRALFEIVNSRVIISQRFTRSSSIFIPSQVQSNELQRGISQKRFHAYQMRRDAVSALWSLLFANVAGECVLEHV